MKRAVSVSIGSSKRDKAVEIELLGQKVRIERIGTDGDMEKAAQLFRELDGVVDAFGLGGADLGVQTDRRYYPLYSIRPIVRYVKKTPLVDGAGLKNTLEGQLAPFIDAGGAWYKGRATDGPRTLSSAGVGLRYDPRPGLHAELYRAHTFAGRDVVNPSRSLQDRGWHLAIRADF